MLEYALKQVKSQFEVETKNVGEHEHVKKYGMKFHIQWFDVKGVGNLSILTATGMFGLMKMDTLIFTPFEKDLPLFSYDLMHVMKKDTFLMEYYDTLVTKEPAWESASSLLTQWKQEAKNLTDCDMKAHWYDNLQLPGTIDKCGKRKDRVAFNELFQKEWNLYLETAKQMPACKDTELKRKKTIDYVNGLFEYGGPSTDMFVKMLGKEEAVKLFSTVIFGTNK